MSSAPEEPGHRAGESSTTRSAAAGDPVRPPPVPDHDLLQLIGRGSYGEVWLGRNRLGTLRAIKIVRRSSFEDRRPFEREFQGIQRFEPVSRSHDGLVDVLQVGGTEEYFYCVMELADNAGAEGGSGALAPDPGAASASPPGPDGSLAYVPRTLRTELRRRTRLPVEECLRLGLGLADALRHLHDHGLVHRDVKPSNVIFVQGVPKLADIGLVAAMDEARSLVGTPGYVPPEGAGTPAADVFSLGKVLYELSTGKDRQEFPQLPAHLRTFPDAEALVELNEVLLQACELDARRRYASAAEMHVDLALLQGGRSVRRLRRMERRLALVTRAGAVVTALALVAAALLWNARRHAHAIARQLYVAEMNLGYQAWEGGNLSRARELIEAQRSRWEGLAPFEWCLLAGLCAESDTALTCRGHEQRLWCVAFAPDGRRLATASADGTVRLWDAASARGLSTLTNHQGAVHAVAFSHDGNWLATGARDQTTRLWNLQTGIPAETWPGHGDAVRCVLFTRDDRWVISGGEDGDIWLWDVAGKREAGRVAEGLRVSQLALSPDGTRLAGCGFENTVRLWNLTTRAKERDLAPHPAHVLAVAFSHDGSVLATGSYDGTARLWDLATGQIRLTLGHGPPVRAVAFSPDGSTLAAAADDGLIKLWDLARGQLTATLPGAQDILQSLAYSPDGRFLAAGSNDRTARVWNLETDPHVTDVRRHTGLVNSVSFLPDGRRFISIDPSADLVRIWSLDARMPLTPWSVPPRTAWCVTVSPDGTHAVTGGLDGSLRWWEVASGRPLATTNAHDQAIDAIACSPDGRWLATGGRDGFAQVREAESHALRHRLEHHQAAVRAVAFSPDTRWLATGDTAGLVQLWNVGTGQEAMRLAGHKGEVRALAFSPDGRTLASGGADKAVRLWNVPQRRLQTTLAGHTATVGSLAFAPDGGTLVSGGWDSTVKLWNLGAGQEVGTLRAHLGHVTHVTFSPDGTTLASASADGTVRLWRAGPLGGEASQTGR